MQAVLLGRPRRHAGGGRSRSSCSACPITPPIATTGRCWRSTPRRLDRKLRARQRRALISEQLRAPPATSRVGDRIDVPAPGGTWLPDMVGIYADYGNPKGQIAVNVAALIAALSEISPTRIGLRVAPQDIPALISALQEAFALDDRNVADQATSEGGIDPRSSTAPSR